MADTQPLYVPRKRLIVCCDGTWLDSDTGYERPTLFNPIGKAQTPSNVTRLSRSLRRVCRDGTLQIITYQNGVGTGSTIVDAITGGAFGRGIAENVREAYSFICANYNDGDDIILIGFSRGAFTARSVAGMIGDLGLLTRAGMEDFYPIFKDMQNWRTPKYKDPFPNIPFPNKPKGENAAETYRQLLLDRGLTRVYQDGGHGELIKVKAIGVWDTVGSLGIPQISWLPNLSVRSAIEEYRFYDTNLSDRIEHAFQALALDERRPPFSPTVWERVGANKHTTELRQVWFPGNHGNVGGGCKDAGIANMSLAWMMDQLASVGVEFDEATIERIFSRLEHYYQTTATSNTGSASGTTSADMQSGAAKAAVKADGSKPWAIKQIYENNRPFRPWGLGALVKARSFLYTLTGSNLRTPGLYKKMNVETGLPSKAFLEDTNERIHSSARVRLAARGLGLNDSGVWDVSALKGNWRPRRTNKDYFDPIPRTRRTWEQIAEVRAHDVAADPERHGDPAREIGLMETAADQQRPLTGDDEDEKGRWVWEYCGPEESAPPGRVLVEEPLGPYERQLLRLASGRPNIYDFADKVDVTL